MPPEILERLQGLLRGFFDRRIEELIPSQGRDAGEIHQSLPDFPTPLAPDATATAMREFPSEIGFPSPMPQDASRIDLPGIPGPPPQHSITARDPSPMESLIPPEVRRALEIRQGAPGMGALQVTKDILDYIGEIHPTEFFAGPVGAAGALFKPGSEVAKKAVKAASDARYNPPWVKSSPAAVSNPMRNYAIKIIDEFPHHTPLDDVASRAPESLRIIHPRGHASHGSVVLVEPPHLPRNIREARADQLGYTVETFHTTAYPDFFEGLPLAGMTGDPGGVIQPWSHFGSPDAGLQRIWNRGEIRPTTSFHVGPLGVRTMEFVAEAGSPARTIPVRIRGAFLQTEDMYNWPPWEVLKRAEDAGVVTGQEVARLRRRMQELERIAGFGGTMGDEAKMLVGGLLEGKGIRGLRYMNAVEDRNSISYLVFNPGVNVRSSLSAAFEPSAIDMPGLLQILAGVGIGTGAAVAATSGGGSMQ